MPEMMLCFDRCCRMFEFKTMIPVYKDLIVGIKDYDLVSADDKIGETTIDLENRYLTKFRAIVGLPQTYCLSGPCQWRDSRKPTEILDQFCSSHLHSTPVYESDETLRIADKVYRLATFGTLQLSVILRLRCCKAVK
jgi:hypothetical protein